MKNRLNRLETEWMVLQESIDAKQGKGGRDLRPWASASQCQKEAEDKMEEIERIQSLIEENKAKRDKDTVKELPFICPDCEYHSTLIVTVQQDNRFQVDCEKCGFQKNYVVKQEENHGE